jgi:hypothetical protein
MLQLSWRLLQAPKLQLESWLIIGLACQGKDIVFRFIIEYYSSLKDFGP